MAFFLNPLFDTKKIFVIIIKVGNLIVLLYGAFYTPIRCFILKYFSFSLKIQFKNQSPATLSSFFHTCQNQTYTTFPADGVHSAHPHQYLPENPWRKTFF